MKHGMMITAGSLAAALLLGGCQPETQAQHRQPERPVLVETVTFTPSHPERSFVATVRPRIESDLSFRVPGKIARRHVSVGDVVTPGQVLAILDETDLRLQREQAEAERTAATASLAQAEAEYARITALIQRGWSTNSTQERQRALTEEARGRLARAERAQSLAENALSYAELTSNAEGVVTATLVEPGQVVSAGQPSVRIARTDEKEAVAAIPETLVGLAREGRATITLWSRPDRRYVGRLRELSPSADPASRTYQARFTIEGAGDEVALGMTATVILAETADLPVARLPLSALFNQGGGPAVWVVQTDGSLVLRPVAVRSYEAREVLVSGGVSEGDRVVALGVQKLDPAQRVRVVSSLQF